MSKSIFYFLTHVCGPWLRLVCKSQERRQTKYKDVLEMHKGKRRNDQARAGRKGIRHSQLRTFWNTMRQDTVSPRQFRKWREVNKTRTTTVVTTNLEFRMRPHFFFSSVIYKLRDFSCTSYGAFEGKRS